MDKDRLWRVEDRQTLFSHRIFSVEKLDCRIPTRDVKNEFYTLHLSDWVNIFALTGNDEVIIVRQHRMGKDIVTHEVPAGTMDPGEAPEEAARRELLEETGYEPGTLTLMNAISVNPAMQDNRCYFFLAQDCRKVRDPSPDHTEELDQLFIPVEEFFQIHNAEWMDNSLSYMAVLMAGNILKSAS